MSQSLTGLTLCPKSLSGGLFVPNPSLRALRPDYWSQNFLAQFCIAGLSQILSLSQIRVA